MLSLPFLMLLLLLMFLHSTAQVTYSCDATAPCGCSTNSASVSKIVGGETASINTWGWAVSVLINEQWLCGGSIVSSSWIVTAAHCITDNDPSKVLVSAGSNQLLGVEQWRYASSVIVHPQYDADMIANDIALIQVSPPFNMTDPGISQICLPIPATLDYPPVGSTLVAVGWGALSENGSASETLQQVTLQRIQYESVKCHPLISNQSVQFCAGVPDSSKDTCYGDSGGPLMMFTQSKQWVLVGITSYGDGCANQDYAGVYTRFSYYLDWIDSMNLTGMLTADIVTTTTPYLTTDTTTATAKTQSNSTNNGLSYYQHAPLLFILAQIMLNFPILIVL